MKRYICDRCRADITDSGEFGSIQARIYKNAEFESPFDWIVGEAEGDYAEHYCRKCMDEIAAFIRTPQPRKKIDYGKNMALSETQADENGGD